VKQVLKALRSLLPVALLLLGFAAITHADNTTCDGRVWVIPDGATHEGAFTALDQERWFWFRGLPDRSYTFVAENLSPTDEQAFVGVVSWTMTPLSPSCDNLFPLGAVHTSAVTTSTTIPDSAAGDLSAGSARVSFISTQEVNLLFVSTSPSSGTPGRFRVRVEETTLFSPAWSTFGTFETYYSCVNTTNDGTIDAILRLIDTTGAEVATFNFTDIPAGGTVSTNTEALGVANSLNGSATWAHNGPPGAFICQAAIANFQVVPNLIQPVQFDTARQMR